MENNRALPPTSAVLDYRSFSFRDLLRDPLDKKLWVAGFCLLSSVVVKVTEAKLLANRVAVVTFLND
jgi:hypothetical protein